MTHVHKAIQSKSEDRGYVYCEVRDCVGEHTESAHGGIVRTERCKCGSTRKIEINRGAKNLGFWDKSEL